MMRFVEVTDRLHNASKVNKDGKSLAEAIPTLANHRIWQAVFGGYTWVIGYEPGLPSWSDENRAEWVGYSASYRLIGHNLSSQTVRIDGAPWQTFEEAVAACRKQWSRLRSPN